MEFISRFKISASSWGNVFLTVKLLDREFQVGKTEIANSIGEGGNMEAVSFWESHITLEWISVLISAADSGHITFFDSNMGHLSFHFLREIAYRSHSLEIFKLLWEKKILDFNENDFVDDSKNDDPSQYLWPLSNPELFVSVLDFLCSLGFDASKCLPRQILTKLLHLKRKHYSNRGFQISHLEQTFQLL
jgi:hypothetical protein